MRKNILVVLFLLVSVNLFAQNPAIDEKTGFPVIKAKPFPVFNWGPSVANITRIIKQEDRSNFVYNESLVGFSFVMESKNMQPMNSMIRLAAFYPLSLKFNKHPQVIKNLFNFGIDLFAAPIIPLNMWEYIKFNIAPGLHFLYETSDRWNYLDLGLGIMVGAELPLAQKWTILVNGFFSYDYGNFGTNSFMEPYDYIWQYQLDIAFRYSKKALNKYSYIRKK